MPTTIIDFTTPTILRNLVAPVQTTDATNKAYVDGSFTAPTIGTLTVTGESNLGQIANVSILGGLNGYQLTTDGAGNLSWQPGSTTGVAGSNTQVQYNANGVFGASANLTFDGSTLSAGGNVIVSGVLQADGDLLSNSNAYVNGEALVGGNLVVDQTAAVDILEMYTIVASGEGSIQFGQPGTVTATNSAFNRGTNPWTLEWYQFIPEVPNPQSINNRNFTRGNLQIFVGDNPYGGGSTLSFTIPTATGPIGGEYGLRNVVRGQWNHFAFVRPTATNNLSFFVNGTPLFQGTYFTATLENNLPLIIGGNGSSAYWDGLMTCIRWTNSEVYTGAFVPPEAPLTVITGTQLLLNANTSGSVFTDTSGMSIIATTGTAPTWSRRGPGDSSASITFTVPDVVSSAYDLLWPDTAPSDNQVLAVSQDGQMYWSNAAAGSANGVIQFYNNGQLAASGDLLFANGQLSIDGNLVVTGNMQVDGNVTFIDSNVIVTNDLYIVLANNTSNASQVDGAGIVIGPNGANIEFLYDYANNQMELNRGLAVYGNIICDDATETVNLNVVGNATVATANIANLSATQLTATSANVTTLLASNPSSLLVSNTQVATTQWTQQVLANSHGGLLSNVAATAPGPAQLAGTANTASRSDHVHSYTTAAQAQTTGPVIATIDQTSGQIQMTTSQFLASNGSVINTGTEGCRATNNRIYLPTYASGFMNGYPDFTVSIDNTRGGYPLTVLQDPAWVAAAQAAGVLRTKPLEVTVPPGTVATLYVQYGALTPSQVFWIISEVSMSDCVTSTAEWSASLNGAPPAGISLVGNAYYESTNKVVMFTNGSQQNGSMYGTATGWPVNGGVGVSPTNFSADFVSNGTGDGIIFNIASSAGWVGFTTDITTTLASLKGISVYLDAYNNVATLYFDGVSVQTQSNLNWFATLTGTNVSRHNIKICTFGNGTNFSGSTTPQYAYPAYVYVYLDNVLLFAQSLASWVPGTTGSGTVTWGIIGWAGSAAGVKGVSSVTFDASNDPSPVYGFAE